MSFLKSSDAIARPVIDARGSLFFVDHSTQAATNSVPCSQHVRACNRAFEMLFCSINRSAGSKHMKIVAYCIATPKRWKCWVRHPVFPVELDYTPPSSFKIVFRCPSQNSALRSPASSSTARQWRANHASSSFPEERLCQEHTLYCTSSCCARSRRI